MTDVICHKPGIGETPYRIARLGLSRTHHFVQPLANMTVLENCTVGACFGRQNLPLLRAREVARGACAIVGLEDRLAMLASQLTIAGKKRLELAGALSAQPMLLLLYEVPAGLNPTEIDYMIGASAALSWIGSRVTSLPSTRPRQGAMVPTSARRVVVLPAVSCWFPRDANCLVR